MKNHLKTILIVTIISLATISCTKEKSSDVNQNKIYAEYELFYDKNQDKTFASAVFKFSNSLGTQLQLSAPSEVRFNSDVIPYDPVFAYYRKEYAGFVNTGTFVFKDSLGKTYSNAVSVAHLIANPTVDTIRRAPGAYTYTWIGDSIATNESVGLVLDNVVNPLTFQVFGQNTLKSKNMVLSVAQLNQLPIGMSSCQLYRQIETTALSVTSSGGKIRGKYRALDKNVYIK